MFGDHANFIVPSYLAVFGVIFILIIWLRLQYKSRQNELMELEKSGLSRRSDKTRATNE